MCDIRAIARVAHAADALVCVDNSIMAPVFQRPLDLGADVAMTSATKFIGGHSDITAGTLSVRGADLAQRIYFHQVLAAYGSATVGPGWRLPRQAARAAIGGVAHLCCGCEQEQPTTYTA